MGRSQVQRNRAPLISAYSILLDKITRRAVAVVHIHFDLTSEEGVDRQTRTIL